jgi:hypothetical protein
VINLKDRIQGLKESTGSYVVKQLCEKASANLGDASLKMTSGAYMEYEHVILENLLRDLSEVDDSDAKKFIVYEQTYLDIHNLGVRESYNKLINSDLMQGNAQFGYVLENFKPSLNSPEYLVVEQFHTLLSGFSWHPVVNECKAIIENNCKRNEETILIYRSLHLLENSNSAYILPAFENELKSYIVGRSRQGKMALLEKLDNYMFDGNVRNLANCVRHFADDGLYMSGGKGTTDVNRIYSPVTIFENFEVFGIGDNFYAKVNNQIHKMNEMEVSNLPTDFVNLSRFLDTSSVKVGDGIVDVYLRDKHFSITNEGVSINGNKYTTEDFRKIYLNTGIWNRMDISIMEGISKIMERFDSIVEIDFAKRLVDETLPGRRMDVIRLDENIYIARDDENMGTSDFFDSLNGIQARKLVLEFMNYDLIDAYGELIDGNIATYKTVEGTAKKYLEMIEKYENRLRELENNTDVYVRESAEYEAITIVLRETIEELKAEYADYVAEMHNMEHPMAYAHEKMMPTKVTKIFRVTDRVICQANGKLGTVTGLGDAGNIITIITDDGEAMTCEPSMLTHYVETMQEGIEIKVDGTTIEIEKDGEEGEEDEGESEEKPKAKEEDDDEGEMTFNEDHAASMKPETTTDAFTPKDRVETLDGRYGTVQGFNGAAGKVTVALDDGETVMLDPDQLVIIDHEGVNEAETGDEVEMEDGMRGMVQSVDTEGMAIIMDETGKTREERAATLKVVNPKSGNESEQVEGQQTDGKTVAIKTTKESVNEKAYSITDDGGRPHLLIVGEEPKDSKGKSEYKKDGFYISPQIGFYGLITAYFKDEKTLKKIIDKKYHNQLDTKARLAKFGQKLLDESMN